MAVLTDGQSHRMCRDIWRKGQGKEEFSGANLGLDEAQIKATFQSIEDFWEANKAAVKAGMVAASGVALTNAQAKVLGRAWLQLKASRGN